MFAELRRLAESYLGGSPEPVVLAVRDIRDQLFELLRGHHSPSQARELHLAAGYACVLLAWLSGDFGHLAAARTHAQVGSLFAGTSGSRELGSWVQAVRSKTAFWMGDYVAAAEAAAHGLADAPATSVRVLLAAQVADAWVTAGAQDLARAAVAGTAEARSSVSQPDAVGGLLSCSQAREANYLSGVYQQLGEPGQAVKTADEALALSAAQPVRSYATEAQIRLNRVDVFLELGDLDAASEALAPVLALPPPQRLHTLTWRVGELDSALATGRFVGNDAADGLRAQIATFAASP